MRKQLSNFIAAARWLGETLCCAQLYHLLPPPAPGVEAGIDDDAWVGLSFLT